MTKYYALGLTTSYWKPGEKYIDMIINKLDGKIENGDFFVISEKAISTAIGNVIDESIAEPSLSARAIANFWMRIIWGYYLGILCHFGQRLLRRLRKYPLESGSRHKQVALQHAGLSQALMFGSEGGIDGSNLPYSYVSLPLKNPEKLAEEIRRQILLKLRKNVCVIIADTDKTYKFRNFFFTARPKPMKGVHSFGGTTPYIIGRMFKFRKSSTPISIAGCNLHASEALKIANIAEKAKGPGSGATVWDMAARFKVEVDCVNLDMLNRIKHKPLVIVRIERDIALPKQKNL
jgi:F420-0:gamma-glutamyl ligase-like protein